MTDLINEGAERTSGRDTTPYLFILREGPSYSVADVTVACEIFSREFRGEFWTYGDYEADLMVNGFRARVLKQENPYKRHIAYLQFIKAARQRARELRDRSVAPVVVISSDPFKNGLLGLNIARIVNGQFIAEINGAYSNAYAFSQISNPFYRAIRLWMFRSVGSFVIRRCDGIRLLFDSQLRGFAAPRATTVIRRFYELTYASRFTSLGEEPYVLLAGFPFLVKGADLLVQAFLRVADRHPQWKLILIGHRLPVHLKEFGCSDPRVQAMPGMLHKDLVNWVGRCSILAQPSRTEAMGRILIEAAAAGKCRIATRVDGIPTVIADGVDGLLIQPESIEELAHALDATMGDAALRRRLGDAARARASSDFTPENYLKNYSELIHAVVNRSAGRRTAEVKSFNEPFAQDESGSGH